MLTIPLLACLQHAYYLDYKVCVSFSVLPFFTAMRSWFNDAWAFSEQNDKGKYVKVFMDHLVSWNAAMARMARAEAFVNLGEPKIPIAWDVSS